jgi:hypothetical protein
MNTQTPTDNTPPAQDRIALMLGRLIMQVETQTDMLRQIEQEKRTSATAATNPYPEKK